METSSAMSSQTAFVEHLAMFHRRHNVNPPKSIQEPPSQEVPAVVAM